MKIGAQFYTIRDFCTTTKDLDESLKKVADIGYEDIQLSGVCSYEPEWMAEKLKAYGLKAQITHFGPERYINETEYMIRLHDIIGARYMGIGGFSGLLGTEFTPELLDAKMKAVGPAIKAINKAGHKFMYHNHNKEFCRMADGRTVLEHICDYSPADLMGITLDTYWVVAGGADPCQWLRALKGRVNCIHLKDMNFDMKEDHIIMAPIGEGNMNYEGIIEACRDADVEYAFIEQDNCNGEDPFDCLRRSLKYFRDRGF